MTARPFVKLDDDSCCESEGDEQCHSTELPQKRSLRRLIGPCNIFLLCFCTAMPLLVLSLLVFLWRANGGTLDGKNATSLWLSTMNKEWISQVITLSGILLRISVSVHVTICTSMAASLMVEQRPMPLSRAAPLSVFRSINGGAISFLKQFCHRDMFGHLVKPDTLIACFLILTGIALQFSSTLLISDLGTAEVLNYEKSIQYNLSIPESTTSPRYDKHLSGSEKAQSLIPPFGVTRTGHDAKPNQYGFTDTGLNQEAMVPIPGDRINIRNFQGPMFLSNFSTYCMPVAMEGNLGSTLVDGESWNLTGVINYEDTFRDAHIFKPGEGEDGVFDNQVNCLLGNLNNVCVVQFPPGPMSSVSDDDASPWGVDPWIFLVVNKMLDDDEQIFYPSIEIGGHFSVLSTEGEWSLFETAISSQSPQNPAAFNASICLHHRRTAISVVELSAKDQQLNTPPSLILDENSDLINEDAIFTLLGLDDDDDDPAAQPLQHQSSADRGLFTVGNVEELYNKTEAEAAGGALCQGVNAMLVNDPSSSDSVTDPPTSDEYAQLVSQVIRRTGRAAPAIETLMSLFAQNIHEQLLLYPGNREYFGRIVTTAARRVPSKSAGLIAVCGIWLLSIMCVAFVTTAYLRYARYSFVDNFWHSIAQIASSPLVAGVLDGGSMLTDEQVESEGLLRLGNAGGGDGREDGEFLVRLQVSDETGRVELGLVGVAGQDYCEDLEMRRSGAAEVSV